MSSLRKIRTILVVLLWVLYLQSFALAINDVSNFDIDKAQKILNQVKERNTINDNELHESEFNSIVKTTYSTFKDASILYSYDTYEGIIFIYLFVVIPFLTYKYLLKYKYTANDKYYWWNLVTLLLGMLFSILLYILIVMFILQLILHQNNSILVMPNELLWSLQRIVIEFSWYNEQRVMKYHLFNNSLLSSIYIITKYIFVWILLPRSIVIIPTIYFYKKWNTNK